MDTGENQVIADEKPETGEITEAEVSTKDFKAAERDSVKSNKIRTSVLLVFLVFEIIIMIFFLAKFSKAENQNVMILETSIETGQFTDPDDFILKRYDILDTVTLLTGTEADGRATEENALRKNMIFDPGQAMWLVFEEKISGKDQIFEYAKSVMAEKDFDSFREKLCSDEVVNVLFDMGDNEDTYTTNWREVGVHELQSAPLLPWKKKIDFIILSTFEDKHWGGLAYILKYNPAIPIFCPPLTKSDIVGNARIIDRAQNLVPIMPGYTNLTARLGALVTSMPRGEGKDPRYELDLVLHIDGGVAIITGAGLLEPLEIVRQVKMSTGKEVLYYIGGTNLQVGLESEELKNQLRELKAIAPKMQFYPNYNTSMIAKQMLGEVFKEKLNDTPLGLKIRFNKNMKNIGKGKYGE